MADRAAADDGAPLDQHYRMRVVLWSLTSAWRLTGDAGDLLESRRLATRLKTQIEIRRRGTLVLRVRATRWTRLAARFEIEDGAGANIGALEREVMGSLGRDRWRISDGSTEVATLLEAGHPFMARAIPMWPTSHDVVVGAEGTRPIATIAASWLPTRARLRIAGDAPTPIRRLALAACLVAAHTD